jgi:hypothetical protein
MNYHINGSHSGKDAKGGAIFIDEHENDVIGSDD